MKRRRILNQIGVFFVTCLFILLSSQMAIAASVTVCNAGNGCTYTTIANALSGITGGVANTITVKSPYSQNERVTVNKAGASDANRLVIIADTGYTPVTKGFIVSANYVTINGFEMASSGAAFTAYAAADYVSFLNNDIHGSNGSGYPVELGTDDTNSYRNYVVFQGNKIHGSSATGYTLMEFRANNSLIDNNEFYSCPDCDAIRFWGHDTRISNNYIHDITYGNGNNHSDHFQTFGNCGSSACHTAYNIVIENNMCISTGADLQPFNIENTSQDFHDLTIRNNIFINFGTQGNIGSPYTYVYNNTFIDVGTINQFSLNMMHEQDDGNAYCTGCVVKNNIFLTNFNSAPLAGTAMDGGYVTHTNNQAVRWSGSTYSTISSWSETGGVIGQNPQFVNYTLGTHTCGTYNFDTHTCSNFDLHIASNSPDKDVGADLSSVWSSATDIVGTSRPQGSGWDIGAYEYGAGNQSTLLVTSVNGTVTSNPSGISCGSTCSANYDSGTSVTLTASPASGYTFTGWSGGGCSGTGTCTVSMTAATSVTATFATTAYNLTVTKSGTGVGTVTGSDGLINCGSTCSVNYASGTSVTLTALANSGSIFSGWSGVGCSGTGTCTVTMTAAKSVTATFISNYNLTVTKSVAGAGTITSSDSTINCGSTCSANYNPGTSVTLTAWSNSGYTFTGWLGGGCSGTGTCTVSMNAATSVTATFATTAYNLTVIKPGTGSGTVTGSDGLVNCGSTCSVNYESGKSVTLTASANSGSTFHGWSGACSGTGTCTVTMTAATSVTTTFAKSMWYSKKRR